MRQANETYLGDGLYASYDGFQFRLFTNRGFEIHEVFLEPWVLLQFLNLAEEKLKLKISIAKVEDES